MPSEFALIARHFTRPTPGALLGVGDDAALLAVTPGKVLAVSSDMLVAGRHFFADAEPEALGHKTLAVNLSDLAAMGAEPRWATLALALPAADEAWLTAFSRGFFALAAAHGVDLVGGDTTRGPLNLCVTVMGECDPARALRRDTAEPGDDIWVSGELGGAALALQALQGACALTPEELAICRQRLDRPEPRVALGLALVGVVHAAIDVSDGLLADLGHILERSKVGATLAFASLPAHPAVAARLADTVARNCLLAGGDDYELCFTAAPGDADTVRTAAARAGVTVARIGRIDAGAGLRLIDVAGQPMTMETSGYDHFA